MNATADIMLAELSSAMRERVTTESRILERLEDVSGQIGELKGVVQMSRERTEGVAKSLHDLRQELAGTGVLLPHQQRAEQEQQRRSEMLSMMRAISAEDSAKLRKSLDEDQARRDAALKWGIGVMISLGSALLYGVNWAADHIAEISVFLKMWRGGGQ